MIQYRDAGTMLRYAGVGGERWRVEGGRERGAIRCGCRNELNLAPVAKTIFTLAKTLG